MTYYNLTYIDTSNNFVDLLVGINTATNGYIIPIILFLFFLIMLISQKAYDFRMGLITSSMVTSLLSVLFWAMGLFRFEFIFIPIAILFVGLIWKGLSD